MILNILGKGRKKILMCTEFKNSGLFFPYESPNGNACHKLLLQKLVVEQNVADITPGY